MNLADKITSPTDLLKVDQIENSAFFKECENLYGPLSEDTFWKFRERLRSMYTYDPINIKGLPFHFLHLNHDDPNLIAFTANDKIGKKDGKTFIKPGKYLTQHTNLDNEQIKNVVTEYKHKFVPPKLYLTETPEAVVDIYERGPNSCMSRKGWDIQNHPARAYQGPDTKVAYIKNKSGDGYTARAVIRTDKNPPQYIRIYGDKSFFTKALSAAKIVQAPNGLSGCRLPVMWKEGRENKELLMPYVDGGAQTGYIHKERDKRDFVHMGVVPSDENASDYHHISCTNTGGTVTMPDLRNCGHCGQQFFQDEITVVSDSSFCPTCLEGQNIVVINEGMEDMEQCVLLQVANEYERYMLYKDKWYTQSGLTQLEMFYDYDTDKLIPLNETEIERNTGDRHLRKNLIPLHTVNGIEYFSLRNQNGIANLYLDIETRDFYTEAAVKAQKLKLKQVEPTIKGILKDWKQEYSGPSRSESIESIVEKLEPHNDNKRAFLQAYCVHFNENGNYL